MSRKIQQFTSFITQPLNLHNFLVALPDMGPASILIASTVFPGEKLGIVTLHHQGERVQYTTIPENGGSWPIKVPEADTGLVHQILKQARARFYNQKSGLLVPDSSLLWERIPIYSRNTADVPVFECTLCGAWIRGRGDVQLANDNPQANWNWDYEFVYNWIEDEP